MNQFVNLVDTFFDTKNNICTRYIPSVYCHFTFLFFKSSVFFVKLNSTFNYMHHMIYIFHCLYSLPGEHFAFSYSGQHNKKSSFFYCVLKVAVSNFSLLFLFFVIVIICLNIFFPFIIIFSFYKLIHFYFHF